MASALVIIVLVALAPSCTLGKSVTYKNKSSHLTSLPVDTIPANVTILRLWGNNIQTLRDHDFRLYPDLRDVSLNRNPLYLIEPLTFNGTLVTFLDLSENALTSVPNLDCLNNTLKSLALSFNQVTMVNQTLSSLSRLEILKMEENSLVVVSSQAFCGTSLKELTLSGNDLTSVPDLSCVGYVLRILRLSENHIQHLKREDFSGLQALTSLSLVHNEIESIDKSTFQELSSLQLLSLRYNPLKWTDPLAFNHSPLEEINLSYTYLASFPQLGPINQSISEITAYPKKQGFDDLSQLQDIYLPHLQTLKLMLNLNVTMPTVNTPKLHTLTLRCQPTCSSPFDQLKKQMSLLPSIQSIALIKTGFTEIPDLTNLPQSSMLQRLVLNEGQLKRVHENALDNLTNLTILHLSKNNLTQISTKAFLVVGNTLEDLDLSDNPYLRDIPSDMYLTLEALRTLSLDNTGLAKLPLLPSSINILSISHNPHLLNISPAHLLPLISMTELGLKGSLDSVLSIPDFTFLLTNHSLTTIHLSTFLCNCANAWMFDLITTGDKRVKADVYPCLGSQRFVNKTVTNIQRYDVCGAAYNVYQNMIPSECAILCAQHGNGCHGYKYLDRTCHLDVSPSSPIATHYTYIKTICAYDKQGSLNAGSGFSMFKCTHSGI